MKLDAPVNVNYAAAVVRVPALVDLPGLDNLVGVPVLGHQALTQKGKEAGELVVAFTAETQLSPEFCHHNNLFRDATQNANPEETGYLEANRRIRALKLRGHRSDALLMPLESLSYTGIDVTQLQEGDVFDTLNGQVVCQKYVIPVKPGSQPQKTKLERAFKRVDTKLFPEHLDTDSYGRNAHLLREDREAIETQKLHGTSIRVGRVPCLRKKPWLEKVLNRWFPTVDHTYDAVFGSRKVIKDVNNPNQQHYYKEDIWTKYGSEIADLIPDGFIVYGELIGWTPDGAPIQKGYTYDVPKGQAHLYVYRVATINAQGVLVDLSWDAVKEFCAARGLKWVPELWRGHVDNVHYDVDALADKRFADSVDEFEFVEQPVPLSDKKTVDEGICIRQEGIVPLILKAKSAVFLQHETKLLDAEEVDLESAA